MITDLEAAKLLLQHLEKRVEDLAVSIANTSALLDSIDQKLKDLETKVESIRRYRPSTDIWYKQ